MARILITALVSSLLLSACGGGGGNGTSITAPVAFVELDGANAARATSESYQAAMASNSLGELSGETGFIAAAPGGGIAKTGGSMAAARDLGPVAQIPIPATTEPCAVAGSVTISGDIQDPFTPTLTKNDSFDIEFTMCDDGLGDVTDGGLSFEVDAFAGSLPGGLYDLTMTLMLDLFQVATAEDVVTIDGDATVRLDTLAAPAILASVSGQSLTIDTNTASQALTDYSSTQTFDGNLAPAPYTMLAAGTLDSTRLAGAVRYSTPVTLQGFDDDYPSSGEFLVTGENSSARLIVENNVDVRIEVDADGDGIAEQTIATTWAELEAL